jgi:putative ABC transport system permease protein
VARVREWMWRLWGTLRPTPVDQDLTKEISAHLELAEEALRRDGHSAADARRLARARFGQPMQAIESVREQRGFMGPSVFWLDVKLGLRMLRKSWGLTVVGGLAMTVAIGMGVVVFAVFDVFFLGSVPLDEGERVVAIQTWDERGYRRHDTALDDFDRWRDQLESVVEVGAAQTVRRILVSDGNPSEAVPVAEMSAAGFRLTRIAPQLGRALVEADERESAESVVVIGHDEWEERFGRDPAVIGRTLRFGNVTHTIVGVMPQGFAFPMNHRFWTALRTGAADMLADADVDGVVFARLAAGANLDRAQAEVSALGLLAEADPDERLRARVVPYTFAFTGNFERQDVRLLISFTLVALGLLLVPPCVNIAILVYARTVARQEEFAARYALGATRGRIVVQLFIESLVLAGGAAVVALVIADLALAYARDTLLRGLPEGPPFWLDFRISLTTIFVATGLAVVAASIAGIAPALKATGGQMQAGLRALGSRTQLRLGPTWTVLVVAQVAFSLAVLPTALEMGWGTLRPGLLGPGFPAEQYLSARLVVDRQMFDETTDMSVPFATRFGALQDSLVRELATDADVLGVTVATAVPGQEPWQYVEVEDRPALEVGIFTGDNLVRVNYVDDAYFDVFDRPLLAGRGFEAGDFEPGRTAVVVNREFVDRLLGGENPLGHRLRDRRRLSGDDALSEPGPWHDIVGVVANIRATEVRGAVYHPLTAGERHPVALALRAGGTPTDVVPRLRTLASRQHPAARVEEVRPLAAIYREQAIGNNMGASSLAAVTLSVLLLSAAGMYALMSFTVNQRRREIGIRAALGAQPRRLLAGIFRRALGQLGAGITGGLLLAVLADYYLPVEEAGGRNIPGVVLVAGVAMLAIGLAAATGPARRGLRVHPTEALRDG